MKDPPLACDLCATHWGACLCRFPWSLAWSLHPGRNRSHDPSILYIVRNAKRWRLKHERLHTHSLQQQSCTKTAAFPALLYNISIASSSSPPVMTLLLKAESFTARINVGKVREKWPRSVEKAHPIH